jgi:hypothetical protein
MGLLDDAIREHLDLKRRRGADPSEIERAEREALGPVRRGPEDLDELQSSAEEPLEYGHEEEEFVEEPFDEDLDGNHPEDRAAATPEFASETEVPARQDPPGGKDLFAASAEAQHAGDDEEIAQPPAPHRAPDSSVQRHHGEHVDKETVEYDVDAALKREGGDEDVLEETPEFLQDTPDHDRLWFEQRPPRDFDFEE